MVSFVKKKVIFSYFTHFRVSNLTFRVITFYFLVFFDLKKQLTRSSNVANLGAITMLLYPHI